MVKRWLGLILGMLLVLAFIGCNSSSSEGYGISGTVSYNGSGLEGVSITLDTDGETTTTNSAGNFRFSGLSDGSYNVMPLLAGYTFDPTSQTVTIKGADVTSIDFVAAQ
jgi:hypothetical protein